MKLHTNILYLCTFYLIYCRILGLTPGFPVFTAGFCFTLGSLYLLQDLLFCCRISRLTAGSWFTAGLPDLLEDLSIYCRIFEWNPMILKLAIMVSHVKFAYNHEWSTSYCISEVINMKFSSSMSIINMLM